jgi:hypothetical protein
MQVTKDGEEKIKRWKAAEKEVAALEQRLNRAKTEQANATVDLAKWLLPKDARANETFCVWYGDSLIAAKSENGSERVWLRTKGQTWDKE